MLRFAVCLIVVLSVMFTFVISHLVDVVTLQYKAFSNSTKIRVDITSYCEHFEHDFFFASILSMICPQKRTSQASELACKCVVLNQGA